MQEEDATSHEAELERTGVRSGRVREPRLDEEDERNNEDEQSYGPDAQSRPEAILVKEELQQQRQGKASQASAGPHDAVGQPLALDEPLVHVHDAGAVGDGAADGKEDALGDDEVCRGLGEGARSDGTAHDGQACKGGPATHARVHSQKTHDDRSVEVHDSLFAACRVSKAKV